MMLGAAQIGNDSPFWKRIRVDRSVDQAADTEPRSSRGRCCRRPGAENLKFNLTTWNFLDHTDHAASIQAYAREAGIEIGLEVMDVGEVLRRRAGRCGLRHHDAVAEPHLRR